MIHARRRKAAVFVSILSTRGGGPSSDAGQEGVVKEASPGKNNFIFVGKNLSLLGKNFGPFFWTERRTQKTTVKNGERMMAFGVFWFRGPNR